jgi:beta-1,2-mannobiose phosphorylase / 1,2-beta-oligomannan phosphorylase
MINLTRYPANPIFKPDDKNSWESYSAFNGNIIKVDDKYKMVYRATSQKQFIAGAELRLSVIGLAESSDGIGFAKRRLFVEPEEEWEKFGLEDPRITYMEGRYYIFYTALSSWPPNAPNIRVGLAISKNLDTIEEKHLVTPFNAKGMSLFPEKINGKYAVVLTSDSDYPPSTISIAYLTKLEDLWSEAYWHDWHDSVNEHAIPLVWSESNRVDVGTPPIKTPYGWLLVYCSIKNHQTDARQFEIRAVLLDLTDPQKVIGIVKHPLLVPEEKYEEEGTVPNTIFPTSAIIEDDTFSLYYSASDTTICLATIPIKDLYANIQTNNVLPVKFEKFKENPILTPREGVDWEKNGVFNPTAIKLEDKVYILYRAQSADNTSRFGLAISHDGVKIDERLGEPVYSPREDFESKKVPNGNSGCEDPRITLMDDRIFVCYTAFSGQGNTRVALTSITISDFIARNWNWEKPVLVSAPEVYDKDACLLPEKVEGKYLIMHRIMPGISIDASDTLVFGETNWIKTQSYIVPRPHTWDDEKIGIGPTPIKTPAGWLLIYHGISKKDQFYRVGAMLLDIKNPQIVKARTDYPILEPLEDYEKVNGRGIAFPCGAIEMGEYLYIYYGGGDGVSAVAKVNKEELINFLVNQSNKRYLAY